MVKTRLLRWNLHKKLSLLEARSALDLIGSDRDAWSDENPQFRIRRRIVGLEQILRFFYRRGIHDPFDWVHDNPLNGPRSANVELYPLETILSENSGSDAATPVPVPYAEVSQSQMIQRTHSFDGARIDGIKDSRVSGSDTPNATQSTALTVNRMRDPDVYILAAHAIQEFRAYCLTYITFENEVVRHTEPPVHQFTCQGRLQNLVDEGVFHFTRNDMANAFTSFKLAFLVIEEMLEDAHPMAVAQYFMLICRLTANKAGVIASKMLEHALHLCGVRKLISSRLLQTLQAIYRSQELLEIPLLCLRAAVDCMNDSIVWQWKGLYIKERYCHTLVLAGFVAEGAQRRAKLLDEQQTYYGTAARNVLWTALIVAEDLVLQSKLHAAENRYNSILQESDSLSGFYRAKVRSAAFSGLAAVMMARVRQSCDTKLHPSESPQNLADSLRQLTSAEAFAKEALSLAEVWFDDSATRRIARLREQYAEVLDLSLQVGRASSNL